MPGSSTIFFAAALFEVHQRQAAREDESFPGGAPPARGNRHQLLRYSCTPEWFCV